MAIEHGAIESRLESLGGLLQGLAGEAPEAEGTARALRELELLAQDLAEHFAREESPEGLFAQARAAAPHLDRRVVAVQEQHAAMGEAIRQIVEDAGYAGLSTAAWGRVAQAFETFARKLRVHEREENAIASDAYLKDLGAGD
jgi:hypothetical protein